MKPEEIDEEFATARIGLARGHLSQFVANADSLIKRALSMGDQERARAMASAVIFPALVTGSSELAETCLTLAESGTAPRSPSLLRARGFAAFLKGKAIAFEQAARQTAELAEQSGDTGSRIVSWRFLGLALYFQGRGGEAEQVFVEAQRLSEEADDVANRTEILCWRARIALEAGDVAGATTFVEYASRVVQSNDTTARALLAMTRGLLCKEQNRLPEAETFLRQATDLADATEFGNIRADAAVALTRFLADTGRRSEALEAILPTRHWLHKSGYRFLDRQLAEIDPLIAAQPD